MRKKKNTVARFQSEDQKALYTTKPKGFASDISPDQSITFSRASNIAASAYDSYVAQMDREVKQLEQQERGNNVSKNTLISEDPWFGSHHYAAQQQIGNIVGNVAYAIGQAASRAFKYPGGITKLIKDTVNSYLSRQASSDAQDALGGQARLQFLDEDDPNSLSNQWERAIKVDNELDILNQQRDNLNQALAQDLPSADFQGMYRQLQDVQQRITQLNREKQKLAPAKQKFENLTKQSYDSYLTSDVLQKLGSENYFNDETTPLRDVTQDALKYLWNVSNPNASAEYKLQMLQNARYAAKNVNKNLSAIAKHNQQQESFYENRVSNYFKNKRDTPGMDFFDPDTYLYKLSGVMGSSAGSWRSSLASAGLSIAATAASGVTGGLSLVAAAPIIYNIYKGQGVSENNAEVIGAARDLFTSKIGGIGSQNYKKIIDAAKQQFGDDAKTLTNEQLIDQYLAGNIRVSDSDIRNAKIDTLKNADSLFQHDMVATTGDAIIDTALSVMPIGKLSGLSRLYPIKYARVNAKLAARNLVKSSELAGNIAKRAQEFGKFGGLLGVGGYGAGAIFGTAEGALETGAKKISTVIGGSELGDLGKAVFDKVERARNYLGKAITSKRLREVAKDAWNSPKGLTTRKFVKDYGGRLITSRISEGIEEGKQHQYAQDFKNEVLDQDPTFASILADDLVNGLDIAYDIARIPLDGHFGITIKDQDRLAEIKGGMLAFQPVNFVNAVQDVSPYIQEMRADDAIMNNLIADKTEALDLFSKDKNYLRHGLFQPGYKAFNDAFDTIKKYNQQHKDTTGNWGIAPELIDDEQNRMRSVLASANDPSSKSEAIAMGIKPDRSNPEYQDFLAVKSEVWRKYDKEVEVYNNVLSDAKNEIDKVKSDYIQNARNQHAKPEDIDEEDVDPTQTNAAENIKNENLLNQKVQYSDILARMQALLNIKKRLDEVTYIATIDNKVKNGLQKYYKRINKELDEIRSKATILARTYNSVDYKDLGKIDLHSGQTVNTIDDLSKLIVDKTLHDKLSDQYERIYKQAQNVYNASDTLEYALGKKDKDGNIEKAGHAKTILKKIEDTAKADNDFYDAMDYHIAEDEEINEYGDQHVYDDYRGTNQNGWSTANFNEQFGEDTLQYGYSTKPVFGEWDDNGKTQAKEDFDSAINGIGIQVNPKGVVERGLKDTLDIIAKQQKQAEIDAKYPDQQKEEYQEFGDAVNGENPNAMPLDELIPKRTIDNAKAKVLHNVRQDFEATSEMTDLVYDGTKRIIKSTKGKGKGKYYVLELKNGKFKRNYNLDPKLITKYTKVPVTGFILVSEGELQTQTRPSKQKHTNKIVNLPAIIYNHQFGDLQGNDPQLETLQRLQKKLQQDKNIVIKQKPGSDVKGKYDTTSRSYFTIEPNGKVVRRRRVHAVLLDQYVHSDEEERVAKYNSKLDTFLNVRDIIDYIDNWIKNIADNSVSEDLWTSQIHDLEVYKTYLKDNETQFNNNIRDNEVLDTLDDISHIMGSGTIGISVIPGNICDEITRYFFSSKDVYYNFKNNKEQAVAELAEMSPSFQPGRPYKEWFKDRDCLSDFVDQLIAIKENFDKLGWVISSEPYTWMGDFEGVGKIAGETDLIGVDKAGYIHIIDIKTSYTGFRNKNTLNFSATIDARKNLTVDDIVLNTKKARNFKKELSNKYHCRIVFKVNDDDQIDAMSKTSTFYDLTNQNYGQVRSKYNYYTDQQNAYAAMITQSSFNVKSIELLPFKAEYQAANGYGVKYISAFKNFDEGEQPMRLMLLMHNLNWENQTTIPQSAIDYYNKVDYNFKEADILSNRADQIINELDGIAGLLSGSISNIVADYIYKLRDSIYNYHQFIEQGEDPYTNVDAYDVLDAIVQDLNSLIDFRDNAINILQSQQAYEREMDAYMADYDAYQRWINDQTADSSEEPTTPQEQPKTQQKPIQSGYQYVQSKTHTGAVGKTNLYYRNINDNPELAQITSLPDFITNSTVTVYDNKGLLFCDIKYHGKSYNKILITTDIKRGIKSEAGLKLLQQYEELKSRLQPGQYIIANPSTISRTKGRIVVHYENGNVVKRSLMSTDLIGSGQNAIYDVEMSQKYGLAGYVDKGQAVTWGESDSQNIPLDVQMRPGVDATQDGTFIWIKEMHHNENNKDEKIPVAVQKKKFSKADIGFIIDLLSNPEKRNSKFIDEDGKETNITYRQLLNLLFPIAESTKDVLTGSGNMVKIQLLGTNNSSDGAAYSTRVALRNSTDVATNQLDPSNVFDMSNEDDKKRFAKQLEQLTIPEQHRVMSARLGLDEDPSLPFKSIRDYFVKKSKTGEPKKSLSIKYNGDDTSLQFDMSDFATVNGESGITHHGLSGLGWYVKHNIFETEYDHIGASNVTIGDLVITDDKDDINNNGVGTGAVPQMPSDEDIIDDGYVEADVDDINDDWGAPKIIPIEDLKKVKKHVTKSTAENRLEQLFGKQFCKDHLNVDNTIKEVIDGIFASKKAALVGNCTEDCIWVSQYAPDGVEWHESLHRILELLTSKEEHDKLYKIIAKNHGITYAEDDNTQKTIGELAADDYMAYASGYWVPNNKLLKYVAKIFNIARDYVNVFTNWNDRAIYKMYARAMRGKYKNTKPSQEMLERFHRIYPDGAHYEIHGQNFDSIVNGAMYDKLKQSVLYVITRGMEVDPTGRNINELGHNITKATFKDGIDSLLNADQPIDIIGQKTDSPSAGQLAMREIFDNFDSNEGLREDIANTLQLIATDYNTIQEEQDKDDLDAGEVATADPSDHTRQAFEFSPFTRTTSRVRFFFATIPEQTWQEQEKVYKDKRDGKMHRKTVLVPVMKLNDLGLPQFAPAGYIFNDILSLLHDCDTDAEILHGVAVAAKQNPTYMILYKRLKKIYDAVQNTDNPDTEALWVQLRTQIQNHKYTFELAKATNLNQPESQFGTYSIQMQSTDTDYNAKHYPLQWGSMLANGGTPLIKIDATGKRIINPKSPKYAYQFKAIHDLFDSSKDAGKSDNGVTIRIEGLKQWLQNATSESSIISYFPIKQLDKAKLREGKTVYKTKYLTDPKNPGILQLVKDRIVQALNTVGINMNSAEFEYMLVHKYGTSDYTALQKMVNSKDISDSMTSFLDFLNSVVTPEGQLNLSSDGKFNINGKHIAIDQIYTKFAFTKELANWKYQYRHAHDQLMVLATNNNKYYLISQNNYLTDVARDLNKRGEEYKRLTSGNDVYTYKEDSVPTDENGNQIGIADYEGSYVLHEMRKDDQSGEHRQIGFVNIAGFKTDKFGDEGEDYFQMQRVEDVIMKIALLQNGDIISPTRSDKKSWSVLRGIKLPGFDYTQSVDGQCNVVANPTFNSLDVKLLLQDVATSRPMLEQNDDILETFLRYAYAEYDSIKTADKQLDYFEANGIDKKYSVDNYFKKEQGARFAQLLGIYDDDGNFISFNNNKHSRKEDIKIAEDYFFEPKVFDKNGNAIAIRFDNEDDKRRYQKTLIARNLMAVCDKELKNLEELGLIKKLDTNDIDYFSYENVGLDAKQIQSIYKSIPVPKKDDATKSRRRRSLALCLYVNDISNKSLMSGIEFEKLFAGNPSFYKWKYDDDGNLVDRTVDELKRAGGEGSTGVNNYIELKNVPKKYVKNGMFTGKYVCAEIDNEEIKSPQYDMLKETMETSMIRQSVINKLTDYAINEFEKSAEYKNISKEQAYNKEQQIRDDISNDIDNTKDINEISKQLSDDELNLAKERAKQASDSYIEGIDVADGAAYITDDMCEMLLREIGVYSNDIQEAFRILRSKSTDNILKKASAYQKVVTTVIGTQKYTAFGRRIDPNTGLLTVYYNKYALFPLFECMATGRMSNIYHAMKNQGVDMCMIKSAVKVGSQGAQKIDWNNYKQTDDNSDTRPEFATSFKFNTYEQEFKYLRKQLNTDPTEEKYMNMGTQMTKVAFSNLVPGRVYKMRDGSVKTGRMILDQIMGAMNSLSNNGVKKIDKSFYSITKDKDGNIIAHTADPNKFVRELKQLLSGDDPNRNLIESLQTRKVGDHYELTLQPDAVQSSAWLESKLISRINKAVIDTEAPGAAFIQRSIWGMEGQSMYESKNGGIISDSNIPNTINGGHALQMVNEEGSMDCVLSIDFFIKLFKDPKTGRSFNEYEAKDKDGHIIYDYTLDKNGNKIPVYEKDESGVYKKDESGNKIQKKDKNGNLVYRRHKRILKMSFDDARRWLINQGIIGGPKYDENGKAIPGTGAKANIVAYRIPTQAQASIHALRCVDVLPVVNDTIMLPAEFTKITGSDFDIDKLFLSALNYEIKDKKATTDIQDENHRLQNDILTGYLALLLDKDSETGQPRSMNILHRSIDNDTKLAKDVLKYLEEGRKDSVEEPYDFYSLHKQTTAKDDYITGKIGIGPFALNNNNQILTILYNVKFNRSKNGLMSILNLDRLDRTVSLDGTNVLSWLSAMINAHVDIAKDPWISRLNVGPFTYNIVNLLFRTGFGSNTLYFVNQPIMKVLAKAYMQAGATYMQEGGSKYKRQQDAIENVQKQLFDDNLVIYSYNTIPDEETGEQHKVDITFKDALKIINTPKDDRKLIINKKIKQLFDSNVVKQDAKAYNQLSDEEKDKYFIDKDNVVNQALMYLAYKQFDKYATALSNLVKYCKIDTKKQGKSIAEQYIYKKGYDDLFSKDGESGKLFDQYSLSKLNNNSYIGVKTKNALNATNSILAPYFISATPAFKNTLDILLNMTGHSGTQISTKTVKAMSQALNAAVKSEYFNMSADAIKQAEGNPDYLHDLVNTSAENVDYTYDENAGEITINNHIHNLRSYIGGRIQLKYKGLDGKQYSVVAIITSVTGKNKATIEYNGQKPIGLPNGSAILYDGANTIYDRLARLQVYVNSHNGLASLQRNQLLQMLVPGAEFQYKKPADNQIGEAADTYEHAKFVKLQNFVEDGGINSNYIIDAWDELLHYTNQDEALQNTIRTFARDLVYYAFITSGDSNGFTKMFKYVPASWRKESPIDGVESYSDFIKSKLNDYVKAPAQDPNWIKKSNSDVIKASVMSDLDLDDVILNNWYDNQFIPVYSETEKTENGSLPNFIKSYPKINGEEANFPSIIGAVRYVNGKWKETINPQNAPRFIKIRRHRKAYNTQRLYTIYKIHDIAETKDGVSYPVYVKVNPKGNKFSGGFMITEYGRDDTATARDGNEMSVDESILDQWYKVNDFMQKLPIYYQNANQQYINIMGDLNRQYAANNPGMNIDKEWGLTSKTGNKTDTLQIHEDKQKQKDKNVETVLSSGQYHDIIDQIRFINDKLSGIGDKVLSYDEEKKIGKNSEKHLKISYSITDGDGNKINNPEKLFDSLYKIAKDIDYLQNLQDKYEEVKVTANQLNQIDTVISKYVYDNFGAFSDDNFSEIKDEKGNITGFKIPKAYYDIFDLLKDNDVQDALAYSDFKLQLNFTDDREQNLFDDSDFEDQWMNNCIK